MRFDDCVNRVVGRRHSGDERMDGRGMAAMRLAATRALLVSMMVCNDRCRCSESRGKSGGGRAHDYIPEDGARPLLELEAPRLFDEFLRRRASLLDTVGAQYRYQLPENSQSKHQRSLVRQREVDSRVDSGRCARRARGRNESTCLAPPWRATKIFGPIFCT